MVAIHVGFSSMLDVLVHMADYLSICSYHHWMAAKI